MRVHAWRRRLGLVVRFLAFSLLLVIGEGLTARKTAVDSVDAALARAVATYSQRAAIVMELNQVVKDDALRTGDSPSSARPAFQSCMTVPNPAAIEDAATFRQFDSMQYRCSAELASFLAASDRLPRVKVDARYRALKRRLKDTMLAIAEAQDDYDNLASRYDAQVRSARILFLSRTHAFRERPTFADYYHSMLAPHARLFQPAGKVPPV
ncbi:LemA family protein [Paraburkholderia sp. HP33-1]|uniref:LemA family protein n=1 Tax=Paraburkholderia sp. HP33-1 TaxID=2883243 RepID=UPI001F1CED33|nr:LemA family protein [Paraburkholderia sp. HP33-1]